MLVCARVCFFSAFLDYYGYRDEDDGVLLPLEEEAEKICAYLSTLLESYEIAIAKAMAEWEQHRGEPDVDENDLPSMYAVEPEPLEVSVANFHFEFSFYFASRTRFYFIFIPPPRAQFRRRTPSQWRSQSLLQPSPPKKTSAGFSCSGRKRFSLIVHYGLT
jgi:hypothetical protein